MGLGLRVWAWGCPDLSKSSLHKLRLSIAAVLTQALWTSNDALRSSHRNPAGQNSSLHCLHRFHRLKLSRDRCVNQCSSKAQASSADSGKSIGASLHRLHGLASPPTTGTKARILQRPLHLLPHEWVAALHKAASKPSWPSSPSLLS